MKKVTIILWILFTLLLTACNRANKTDLESLEVNSNEDIVQQINDVNIIEKKEAIISTSYDNSTCYKTYDVFRSINLESKFSEIIDYLVDKNFSITSEIFDEKSGNYSAEYGLIEEMDYVTIIITMNALGNLQQVEYNFTTQNDNDYTKFPADMETMFCAVDIIENQNITSLYELEEYLGKSFIIRKVVTDTNSVEFYYAWRNKRDIMYCIVDADLQLTGKKIGCNFIE